MFKWFKKHFVPHESNNHQPHFLRGKNIRGLIFIVFAVELVVLLIPYIPVLNPVNNNFTAAVLPSVLDDLTNQNRQEQHLSTLAVSPVLNKVAELKAMDMAEKGYFAHTSPEGKAPWYWFQQSGYDYEYAGENLAIDFTDSQDVVLAWMNSPSHRANIIKNSYTEVGTGVATGTYQGKPTIFVAQVYGKPAKVEKINVSEIESVEKEDDADVGQKIVSVVGATTSPVVLGVESNEVATRTPPKMAPSLDIKPPKMYVKTNVLQKYLTSPRHVANIVFSVIGTLVVLALFLKLFIRVDKRHPILITNGLIVLVLIFGVYTVNNAMAQSRANTTTSFISFQNE